MLEDFSSKLAHLLVTYCAPVQPDDFVVIRASSIEAASLCDALQREVLHAHAYPHIDVKLPNTEEILLRYGTAAQLRRPNPVELGLAQHANVFYRIVAPTNTCQVGAISAEKIT